MFAIDSGVMRADKCLDTIKILAENLGAELHYLTPVSKVLNAISYYRFLKIKLLWKMELK